MNDHDTDDTLLPDDDLPLDEDGPDGSDWSRVTVANCEAIARRSAAAARAQAEVWARELRWSGPEARLQARLDEVERMAFEHSLRELHKGLAATYGPQ
jgi:hypothetical protein